MKRLLFLSLLALAFAAPAMVLAKSYEWRTTLGSTPARIATTGSCTAKKGTFTLTLSCRTSNGTATARYDFKLPDGVYGTIDKKVSFSGSAPSVRLSRSGNTVSVFVTRKGAAKRTTIQLVSICFYD
jgi:hypothetical protein